MSTECLKEFFLIKKSAKCFVMSEKVRNFASANGTEAAGQGFKNVCMAKIDIASLAQLARARDL